MMIEERSATVTLTLKITGWVGFAPIERDGPITDRDFIENAIGSIPESVFKDIEGEGFAIAYPIDGEVHVEGADGKESEK